MPAPAAASGTIRSIYRRVRRGGDASTMVDAILRRVQVGAATGSTRASAASSMALMIASGVGMKRPASVRRR